MATKGEKRATLLGAVGRFLTMVKPDRKDIGIVFFYAVLVGLLSLAVPVASKSVVNTITFGALLQPLFILVVLVFAGLVFSGVVRLLQIWMIEYIQRRIFVRVSLALADRLPRVKHEVFAEKHGPELVNRFLEVASVQKATALMLLEGVTVFFQAVCGLILLGIYHPLLLGFSFFLVLGFALLLLVGRGSVSTAIDESECKYRVLAWLEELARHPTLYRSEDGSRYAFHEADQRVGGYLEARSDHFRKLISQHAVALLIQALGSAALLGAGAYLVIKEQLSLGQLVASELVLAILLNAVAKLGKHFEVLYDLAAASEKLNMLFHLPLEPDTGAHSPLFRGPFSVKVSNLSVTHGMNRALISNLNFSVAAGEKVSIFGANGAGKSGLANILYKLSEAEQGIVEIGGYDIREIHPFDIRSRVALVRGIEIFPGTILENVIFGRPHVTAEKAHEVLRSLGILDALLALPDGLVTRVSPSGAPLSSGQALLVTLARALAGEPGLLLLDESLDNIDTFQSELVYATLLGADAPWTLIDFTHDIEVWKHFSVHYVLEGGQLR